MKLYDFISSLKVRFGTPVWQWMDKMYHETKRHNIKQLETIKIGGKDLTSLLLTEFPQIYPDNHKFPPAQILQGMWQAHGQISAAQITSNGQIRAAIIRGCFGVLATSGLGGGIYFYRQTINKELTEKDKEVTKNLELAKELRDKAIRMAEDLDVTNKDKDAKIELLCKTLLDIREKYKKMDVDPNILDSCKRNTFYLK